MKPWIKRVVFVLAGIASFIIIFNTAKTGIDKLKDKQDTTTSNETAQVQVYDLAA